MHEFDDILSSHLRIKWCSFENRELNLKKGHFFLNEEVKKVQSMYEILDVQLNLFII